MEPFIFKLGVFTRQNLIFLQTTIKLIITMLNCLKGSKSKKDPLEMFPTLQYVTFIVRTNKYVLLIIPLKDSFQQQRKLKF